MTQENFSIGYLKECLSILRQMSDMITQSGVIQPEDFRNPKLDEPPTSRSALNIDLQRLQNLNLKLLLRWERLLLKHLLERPRWEIIMALRSSLGKVLCENTLVFYGLATQSDTPSSLHRKHLPSSEFYFELRKVLVLNQDLIPTWPPSSGVYFK